jgi:Spy/CpxP family protein refolding chaperone
MKTCRHWKLLTAAVLALSTTTVTAQNQGHAKASRFSGESPNDPSYLLASESVQKELLLTDSQKASFQKLRDEESKTHPFASGIIGLSNEQIQMKVEQHAKENRDQVAKILTPKQNARLNEINIQMAGVAALSFDDVAGKLDLSTEQQAKLKYVADEARAKQTKLNDTYNGSPAAGQKSTHGREDYKRELTQITADRKSQSLALLTDEQRAKFQKLQGEKFDTSTIQPNRKSFSSHGRIGASTKAPPVRQSTSP